MGRCVCLIITVNQTPPPASNTLKWSSYFSGSVYQSLSNWGLLRMFCFVSTGNDQARIQPSCSDLFASSHVAVGATPTPPQLIPHLSPHIHPSVLLGHRLNLGFPPPTPCPFHTTTGTTYSQPAPASHCWHCNRQDYKERGHQNNQADRRTRTVRPSSWTEVRNYLVLFNCHLWGSWRDWCDLRSSSYKHSILSLQWGFL